MKLILILLFLIIFSYNATANNGRLEVENGIITLYVEATQTKYSCNANGSYLFPISELRASYDLNYANKVLNDTIQRLEESNNNLKLKENEAEKLKEDNLNLREDNGSLKSRNEIYYSLIVGSGIAVVILILLMAQIVKRSREA